MRKGFLGVLSFAFALTSLAQPVSGPLVSTNRGVPIFSQTNGKKIDPSPVYIDAIGNLYFGGPGTVIVNDMTTAERNLLSATNGMVIYNTTTGTVQFRQGGAWLDLGTGTGDVGFANFDDAWFRTNGAIVRPALAKTLPHWVNVADVAYGATPGAGNNNAAVQAAVNTINTTNGGTVYFPRGRWGITSLTITNAKVTLRGDGNGSSLFRLADSTNNLLTVSGPEFQIRDMRVEEDLGFTNQAGSLVLFNNVSDWIVDNCWFFGGRDQLTVRFGATGRARNNIFEASRRDGLRFEQHLGGLVNGNSFFAEGLDATVESAAVRIAQDPSYVIASHAFTINGNYFYYGRYSHSILLTNAALTAISGNFFHLSGMYDPGTKDDIVVRASTNITIAGNVSGFVYNDYIPGNRATRYVVNVDSASRGVKIIGNAFESGLSGIVLDAAPDTEKWLDSGTLMRSNLTVHASIFATNDARAYNLYGTNAILFGPTVDNVFYEGGGAAIWQTPGKAFRFYNVTSGRNLLNVDSAGNAIALGGWQFTNNVTAQNIISTNEVLAYGSLRSPIVVMGDITGNAGVIYTNAASWIFQHSGKAIVFHNGQTGSNQFFINTNNSVTVSGTMDATDAIQLNAKNLYALAPGANVTFSTNVGAKELTINSTGGGGGGGGGSGSLQNATVTGSGTDYTITDTYARVDFGAGDPTHTLPAAGTYLLIAHFSQESANTFVKRFKFRDTTASADVAGSEILEDYSGGGHPSEVAIHAVYTSPGANTVQLWAQMNDPAYSGTHVVWSTNCTFSYVRLDGVLGLSVNAASVDTPNIRDVSATGTIPSATWTINAASNTDLTIGPASSTAAGVVTTGTQSFDGDKTFLSTVNVTNAVNANSLKVTNTVDFDGTVSIGAIASVETDLNAKALASHVHGFGTLTAGTNSVVMSGNFKDAFTRKSQAGTLSGATPTVDWQTEPLKFHIVSAPITYGEANRPTSSTAGESMEIHMTNSTGSDQPIVLPSGWRDETGVGFTNLVAGKTATIYSKWNSSEVKFYWRTYEP